MSLDLADAGVLRAAEARPWERGETYWRALTTATSDHSAPVVAIGLEALAHNAHDLRRRAGGLPIRVATKSVRVRSVLDAVLALPGYRGALAYTVAEAVWLSAEIDDVVVAYPSADRAAIGALVADDRAAERVTLMIDSTDQLDMIDSVAAPGTRNPVRVCLDLDASWRSRLWGSIGVLRSPVHTVAELRALAGAVLERSGFELVGVMSYEAQIAGVGDAPAGKPVRGALTRSVQRSSMAELRVRRAEAIAAVREMAELEFVNGGGTGSLERTAADGSVTEVAAGSGLFGSHLFDAYRAFDPAPAVAFALDVVRRPSSHAATLMGGGWIASGAAGADRSPRIVWPRGLEYAPREGAGEVQTPVIGAGARDLGIGDRVWMRHAKAGEPMEHCTEVVPVMASTATAAERAPTYRGEGKCFV